MALHHATCVAFAGSAALLQGPSGSGKSDLAFRLIDAGGRLVADDQVEIGARDGALWASPPTAIAGLMEVRGIGLVRLPYLAEARVRAVVALTAPAEIERLPEGEMITLEGISLPLLRLAPFEVSAVAKLKLMLRRGGRKLGSCAPDGA